MTVQREELPFVPTDFPAWSLAIAETVARSVRGFHELHRDTHSHTFCYVQPSDPIEINRFVQTNVGFFVPEMESGYTWLNDYRPDWSADEDEIGEEIDDPCDESDELPDEPEIGITMLFVGVPQKIQRSTHGLSQGLARDFRQLESVAGRLKEPLKWYLAELHLAWEAIPEAPETSAMLSYDGEALDALYQNLHWGGPKPIPGWELHSVRPELVRAGLM